MARSYLLGFDVGSSSVKTSLVDADSGKCVASAFSPASEAPILSVKAGWAEQDPDSWWQYAREGLTAVMAASGAAAADIRAIGISYQMHGLVCVGRDLKPLRPAVIWCDSRAVPYGERAFRELGADRCLSHLLNSPGNFTAAKLAWVKDCEPQVYEHIYKVMLPGDYLAMRLTGEPRTTVSGLSEGMFWDFKSNDVARFLLDYYGFDASLLCDVVPSFGPQGELTPAAAAELGLRPGTPVTYRGGDQPNNALSLNVMNPGEIAATAGTSGVVYGVLGDVNYDPLSRVNTFAHVNHNSQFPIPNTQHSTPTSRPATRLGVLLCINGTGILNSWVHHHVTPHLDYPEMNDLAAGVPIGSEGLVVMPFGNGAERVLENREVGCSIQGLNFNRHTEAHLIRAAQEGIVFSFCYGIDIMRQMGMDIHTIHAGKANMFQSTIFRDTLSSVSQAAIDVYKTDGADGAAKGAGIGAGIYRDANEAFASLEHYVHVEPDSTRRDEYLAAYDRWKQTLMGSMK